VSLMSSKETHLCLNTGHEKASRLLLFYFLVRWVSSVRKFEPMNYILPEYFFLFSTAGGLLAIGIDMTCTFSGERGANYFGPRRYCMGLSVSTLLHNCNQ
jgi:hypothetical protein